MGEGLGETKPMPPDTFIHKIETNSILKTVEVPKISTPNERFRNVVAQTRIYSSKVSPMSDDKTKSSRVRKVVQEPATFQERLLDEFVAKNLVVTKGQHLRVCSEAHLMLLIHDVWRVFYLAVYFYIFPFAVLACSAYYTLD